METRDGIATGMAQVLDRVQALSGVGMAGQANNALQSVTGQVNEGLTKVLNALDELAGNISHASKEYGVHDGDAARSIQSAVAEVGADPTVANILRG